MCESLHFGVPGSEVQRLNANGNNEYQISKAECRKPRRGILSIWKLALILAGVLFLVSPAYGVRIKDIAEIKGVRSTYNKNTRINQDWHSAIPVQTLELN